jgi:hypothetical protein
MLVGLLNEKKLYNPIMNQTAKSRQPKRNTRALIVFSLVAILYCLLLYFNLPFTKSWKLDGIIGVLYGLYTASHPAANVLDLLFYARDNLRRGLSKQAYALWWALNGFALIMGWFTIVFGLIRFTAR